MTKTRVSPIHFEPCDGCLSRISQYAAHWFLSTIVHHFVCFILVFVALSEIFVVLCVYFLSAVLRVFEILCIAQRDWLGLQLG
jgi:hypothetical protein